MEDEKSLEVHLNVIEGELAKTYKDGFVRAMTGALLGIMHHWKITAEEAMDALAISEGQREWYRGPLRELTGEPFEIAVNVYELDDAMKAVVREVREDVLEVLPSLLKAISEGRGLSDAGLEAFFAKLASVLTSESLASGLAFKTYSELLGSIKRSTESLPGSVALFEEVEERFQLGLGDEA